MALFRLVVVAALFLLASQATAHTLRHNNHVIRTGYNYRFNNYNPKPEKKPKSTGNSNNGGTPTTQVANPTVDYFNPNQNTVDTINRAVQTTTETMAESPQSSGTCDGNHRAFGSWLAVIIAVSLCYHLLL